uniref:Purple acid phosphatase N-terminal domain-containing protein n=1 Tax=Leptocylindrus danicus TaxID=163516 RepID=A0A7S2PG94_9STRA|mmetsp:Transcript_31217/g.45596  ORF Transcript_31217/g.45596 Transcript_31217/m.45596 type:complete len:683 (+) Transcript_31217:205-2253(+)
MVVDQISDTRSAKTVVREKRCLTLPRETYYLERLEAYSNTCIATRSACKLYKTGRFTNQIPLDSASSRFAAFSKPIDGFYSERNKVPETYDNVPLLSNAYSASAVGNAQKLDNRKTWERKKKFCSPREFVVTLIALTAFRYLFGVTQMPDDLHVMDLRDHENYRHEHVVPTLLSTTKIIENVIDGENGDYLVKLASAVKNEVYDRLNSVDVFLSHSQSSSSPGAGQVKLMLDKEKVLFGEAITLTWSSLDVVYNDSLPKQLHQRLRYFNDNDQPVNDSDIIALYCWVEGTKKEMELLENAHKYNDATTIYQVKKAAAKLFPQDRNTWRISQFPIIREESCEFRLWGNVYTDAVKKAMVLKGTSEKFEVVSSLETPTAIHLALTTSPTEMRVHFTTGSSGSPIVFYGTDPEKLTQSEEGKSRTYAASDMCEAPANKTGPGKFTDPGMLHDVLMKDLKPDTRYFYKVGLKNGNVWSPVLFFISAPPVGPDSSYTFVVFADHGCPAAGFANEGARGTSAGVATEVRDNNVRAVHIVGDLSYADGAGHVYDSWFDMIQPFSSLAPLMVTVGNHEYAHTTGGIGKDPSSKKQFFLLCFANFFVCCSFLTLYLLFSMKELILRTGISHHGETIMARVANVESPCTIDLSCLIVEIAFSGTPMTMLLRILLLFLQNTICHLLLCSTIGY